MPDIINSLPTFALWAVIAYLIGSIPSGVIIARVMGLGNLRDIGSGNIGATNVLRTGSKKAAALTLLFDAGKGLVAVLLARAIAGPDVAQLAGFAAMIGHCFPVWLKFNGGKGVATFYGVLFGVIWPVGLIAAVAWLATAALLRFSSLAALVAALSAPIAGFMGWPHVFFLTLALCALIFARHRANIHRLLAGEESKIGQK
ncbi:glycerol-3-phosphate 1-O-acyltransferase PlsY [Pseudooctadecabacter sp.]|uniref:glycerol-3-phosphate 1-O-acyltransferase PlsY n=1 Tax=Pseudooctadecabacter sp. TaxID=1966338 RepID=UPI0025D15E24|nr:glycerol-3-phosphate 1-O-acyltransferase PlsY [Pseudooctadecabacter sp.]